MPKKGTYLTLTVLGFILGVLWGALCISPYGKLTAAIAANDYETAQANAKKIRIIFIIGMVINVLFFIGKMGGA